MIGRQSAVLIAQVATLTSAKYTTVAPMMVSKAFIQLLKRFLRTHSRGLGGLGGSDSLGMAVMASFNIIFR